MTLMIMNWRFVFPLAQSLAFRIFSLHTKKTQTKSSHTQPASIRLYLSIPIKLLLQNLINQLNRLLQPLVVVPANGMISNVLAV